MSSMDILVAAVNVVIFLGVVFFAAAMLFWARNERKRYKIISVELEAAMLTLESNRDTIATQRKTNRWERFVVDELNRRYEEEGKPLTTENVEVNVVMNVVAPDEIRDGADLIVCEDPK